MKHTLSILLQNEVGALVRVAGLFAARGHNIDSLHVARTDDPEISHLTLTVFGDAARLRQILSQTRKLVDVLEVDHASVSVPAKAA